MRAFFMVFRPPTGNRQKQPQAAPEATAKGNRRQRPKATAKGNW